MKEYQLEIKQIVDYPRCRIYREFVQTLISNRKLRTSTSSHLFHYTVLCSYANFRTSYLRLDGVSYTIRPGEWLCRITDLMGWFRVRFQYQAISILTALQQLRLITFSKLDRGPLIRYRILGWCKYNTVLDYNCPCQKDTGFFFMPISVTTKLVGTCRSSEIDIVLDLWLSAVYRDHGVPGSEVGPIVYYRNGTGNPMLSYSELAQRWGRSRSSVGCLLKKLSALGYLSLFSFPGRCGSVIYLNTYLSTMFQIEDAVVCKETVAMQLNITQSDPALPADSDASIPVCVSENLLSVPKLHIGLIARKTAAVLAAQSLQCIRCRNSRIKLYPLSDDCQGTGQPPGASPECLKMEPALNCRESGVTSRFSLALSPLDQILAERSGRNAR